MTFYKNFRKYLHAVEVFSGALLLFIGGLVFLNKLTWLTSKLGFLNAAVLWLEHGLTSGNRGKVFWVAFGLSVAVILAVTLVKNWAAVTSSQGKKTVVVVATVLVLIAATYFADEVTRVKAKSPGSGAVLVESIAGTPAPDVTFKGLDGTDVPLSKYRGQVVLVNFWATWCEPCYVEIPWLIEMQEKYGTKGFTVLGIAMDEEGKSAVAPFLAKERFNVNGGKFPMNYPIVLGNDDVAAKFGGLLGYPTSFLISKDGKEIKKIQGLISYEEITKAIESQL